MYQVFIVLFCLIRSIVIRKFFNKKGSTKQQDKQIFDTRYKPLNENNIKQTGGQTSLQVQLRQAIDKRRQIQTTIQQFNTPSTFAKYSKMQRQLTKLNNKIQSIQSDISKQQNSANRQAQRPSLLQIKKKQINKVHSQIANKDLLIKAFTNLALIYACSYLESSQISACVSYPLYTFCNQSGRVNGAWIFIVSTIIFSH